jgi:capsule polysaccharide export protein KpsE/RkpR
MKNKSNLTDIRIANRVIDEFREQTLRQAELIYKLSNELYIVQEKKRSLC